MTPDQLKAAAEKYDEKMRKTDPEMNGLSMREEAFIAGAELMRAEIIERITHIREDWKYAGDNMKVYACDYLIVDLASIQAAPIKEENK